MAKHISIDAISSILDEKYIDQELMDRYERKIYIFVTKNKDQLQKSLSSLEAIVLLYSQMQGIKLRNSINTPPNRSVIEILATMLKEKNKIWPELSLFNDKECHDLHNELITNCFKEFATKVEAPKAIAQLAPKFYDSKDERTFNKKFEDQKLKEKQRRLKKKIANEIAEETNLLLDKEKSKQKQNEVARKKKMRKIMGELQAQSKTIERENTSLTKVRRIKKKGKRIAGSKVK